VNRYDLRGRIAIITGGAGGIGTGLARHMLDAGATVELWDRDAGGLARAAQSLATEKLATTTVDITDADAVGAAAAACARKHGRIDILINNAGILGEVKPIWETSPDNFRRVIEIDLVGAYLAMRAIVGLMRTQEPQPLRGHVVNVSSIQGKEGMAMAAAYSAAKAGLMALTKTVAKETAKDGIVVTCITPAAAETSMAQELTAERRADIVSRIPMGRFVELDEIARMVLWLCAGEVSFSSGGIFDISGGRATY
jgi:2-dehydro-3-deoxy-L-rhamnonate dehydrogenase (NAD+)